MLDRRTANETITVKKVKSSPYGGSVEGDPVTVNNVSIEIESTYANQSGETGNKGVVNDVEGVIYVNGDVDISKRDHVILPDHYACAEVVVVGVTPFMGMRGLEHKEVRF